MQVDFYHLDRSPLERVLPRIAERVVESGGRLLVVSADEALAARLDAHLWNYTPDSFLPHARAGGEGDALQPILIAASPEAANGARNIALADGIWREEALTFDRAFHFFDGETIAGARAAWRALAGRAGVEARYWKQDDEGKWRQGP
jgi:DNA polymerase III subunit chi